MNGGARRLELGLAALTLSCGVGLAFLGSATGVSDGTADLRIKIALGTTAVLLLLFARRGWVRRAGRLETGTLVVVGLLGVAAFYNLGVFRHAENWGFLNRAELFHYQLGSRFFPELGYDGLYVASLLAQRQSHPTRPMGPIIRDLRTNQLTMVRDAMPHAREVRARFTPERWEAFVADHARYLEANRPDEVDMYRRDHGYNPTPAWTFVGRLVGAHVPSTTAGLGFLASFDVILLGIAFTTVWRTFGARAACLGIAILGLGHGWRSIYTGSFLRLDWLAATLCGLCLLERRRWTGAGALLGYATAVRVFPVLFLAGPGLLAAKALRRRERPAWAFRLAAGFALAVAIGIAAGCLAGRGPGAWMQSFANLEHHRELWPPNRVSMDNVIVNLPYLYDHFVTRGSPPEAVLRTVPQIMWTKRNRWLEGAAVKAVWLVLLGAAMWRATPTAAAVLGLGAIFVLTPLGAYYWVMLAAIPLRRETPAALAVLLLGLALYAFQWRHPQNLMMEIRFALMSLGLAALLLGWMLPEALRTLRSSTGGLLPRAGTVAITAALVLLGSGCTPRAGPDVVVILIDTLRRDHVGCYGAARDTTPAIDAFAAEAIRFDTAYATAPWTQPSVASMLTGLYPSRHGLKSPARLPSKNRTLAEILHQRGYATGAVVSHTLLGRKLNFDKGFEHWDESPAVYPVRRSSTDDVTRAAQRMLRELTEAKRSFFLLVHYFDPHYDYLRHPRFGFAAERSGRLDGTQTISELRSMDDLTPDEVAFLRDLYDEEVAHTDAGVSRLLDTLRELGRYDDALIIVTADHGEEFLERGWLGHTRSLHDEVVRVPLILRPPGGANGPRVIDDLVSLVSLAPTVLDYAGVDLRPLGLQGPSWRPLVAGDAVGPEAVLVEVDFVPLRPERLVTRTHKKAVVFGRHKLIREDRSGELRLYDLQADPGERHDLSSLRPELRKHLATLLEGQLAAAREGSIRGEAAVFSEEEIRRLQALGYVDP